MAWVGVVPFGSHVCLFVCLVGSLSVRRRCQLLSHSPLLPLTKPLSASGLLHPRSSHSLTFQFKDSRLRAHASSCRPKPLPPPSHTSRVSQQPLPSFSRNATQRSPLFTQIGNCSVVEKLKHPPRSTNEVPCRRTRACTLHTRHPIASTARLSGPVRCCRDGPAQPRDAGPGNGRRGSSGRGRWRCVRPGRAELLSHGRRGRRALGREAGVALQTLQTSRWPRGGTLDDGARPLK
ncbi:hypothetical protein BJ546DRAFT_439418 [Cryomyces antarcticus]